MTRSTLFLFTTVSLILIACKHTEKTDTEILKQTFENYLTAKGSTDVKEEYGYIHPEYFDYFSKENQIVSKQNLKSDTSIIVDNDSIESVSEIYQLKETKYALIKYRQRMQMNFQDSKNEGGASLAISLGYGQFQKQYGKENVAIDQDKYIITVILHPEMYCIYDPKYKDWKFLPKYDSIYSVVQNLIPTEILKKNEIASE